MRILAWAFILGLSSYLWPWSLAGATDFAEKVFDQISRG